ncbi:MAG: glycosyltransferase family 2 protein [Phycisphaerae bacterium]|nr:glycosyltransferase family 2 protein [Phycisphaerae bacterium]
MSLITVVIPVYNEESCLLDLHARLFQLEKSSSEQYEYLFVDDGSTDTSREIIQKLADEHENVKYLFFTRNFGHEAATTAGLDRADGDAVILIDADLQDPPEVIPELIEKWRQGYKIVYAQRRTRKEEPASRRFSAWVFYRIMQRIAKIDIPIDTGDFRLMDKVVVEQFRRFREHARFVRGLVAWTGFKEVAVPYDRDERFAGQTKYNFGKLFLLAIDAITGFSNVPLRLAALIGLVVAATSFIAAIIITIEGQNLQTAGIFFIGATQLLILSLLGEYTTRIHRQSQHRPLYIVAEKND